LDYFLIGSEFSVNGIVVKDQVVKSKKNQLLRQKNWEKLLKKTDVFPTPHMRGTGLDNLSPEKKIESPPSKED